MRHVARNSKYCGLSIAQWLATAEIENMLTGHWDQFWLCISYDFVKTRSLCEEQLWCIYRMFNLFELTWACRDSRTYFTRESHNYSTNLCIITWLSSVVWPILWAVKCLSKIESWRYVFEVFFRKILLILVQTILLTIISLRDSFNNAKKLFIIYSIYVLIYHNDIIGRSRQLNQLSMQI